jgi:dihydrodipicolinate synthase/N-acetylneuraminate lyase
LPVGIYVRPSSPDSPLDLDLWCEVIAHPNVHFVKDSSSSKEHRAAIVEMKAKRTELVALTGDEFDTVSAADAGYDGCLLGTGILNAGFIRRAFDALAAGDRAGADAWQERSNTFLYDLFRHDRSGWLGGLKYALKHLGIFSDEFLHLSFPQTDEDRDRIRAALEREVEVVLPKALT